MNGEEHLSVEERKALVEILAFRVLEESVLKHYKSRNLGRITRHIKKKWRKVLPLLKEDFLSFHSDPAPGDLKHAIDTVLLYSRLYADIIDPYTAERCRACVKKLGTLKMMPSLAKELEGEIDKLVALKPGPKKKTQQPLQPLPVREYPHLNPNVRRNLVTYFKKKLKETEPVLMMDPGFRLRVDNLIRRHVDRIIDVSLEHGYKAMQYGYVGESTGELSRYVEERGRESIDWMIAKEVLLEELARELQ